MKSRTRDPLAAARQSAAAAFRVRQPAPLRPDEPLDPATPSIWTIGHGRSPFELIRDLLRAHEIERLVDVRAVPYSRWALWARRQTFPADLDPIEYTWMGDTLGGKGILDWNARLNEPDFVWGIDHLAERATERRTVILCSESKPIDCHRRLLVGRALLDRGFRLVHLLHDGGVLVDQ